MNKTIAVLLSMSAAFISTTSVLIACSSTPLAPTASRTPPLVGPRVSVMTYNVENLFDTTHDEGKNDATFMPLKAKQADPKLMALCDLNETAYYRTECRDTDWSEEMFEKKISRIADVIRQVDDGRGPDIQILVEVENKNAIELLRTRKLANLGYQTSILLEGPDERGIDTAIMSRLKEWDRPRLHIVPYKDASGAPDKKGARSRGILEARLLLPDGQKISVFAVHFPSQGGPTYLRAQAVEHLNKLKRELPSDVIAIAGGDFNIITTENEEHGYFTKTLAGEWQVSHLVGCSGCEGTHWYRKDWSFLDALLFDSKLKSDGAAHWTLDTASIRIPREAPGQANKFGEPNRFKPDIGVSDHFPLYAQLVKVGAAAPTATQK